MGTWKIAGYHSSLHILLGVLMLCATLILTLNSAIGAQISADLDHNKSENLVAHLLVRDSSLNAIPPDTNSLQAAYPHLVHELSYRGMVPRKDVEERGVGPQSLAHTQRQLAAAKEADAVLQQRRYRANNLTISNTPATGGKVRQNTSNSTTTTALDGDQAQAVSGPITQLSRNELYINKLIFGEKYSEKLEQYAGHMVIGPHMTNTLFFWLMKASHQVGKKKLVLWFNGGPGCSSMTGAMMEVGPFKFKYRNSQFLFEKNSADITHHASVLYIDHPQGTGLSILSKDNIYPTTYDQWIDTFIEFIARFMDMFPEFKGSDIYFSGESFAGFYLPHLSRGLLNNIAKVPGVQPSDVRGIIVGNPWFDPVSQFKSYYGLLRKNSIFDANSLKEISAPRDMCYKILDEEYGDWNTAKNDNSYCNNAYFNRILSKSREIVGGGECINVYDIRLHDKSCGMLWPDSVDKMSDYFSLPEVVESLHIAVSGLKTKKFVECTNVNSGLESVFNNSSPGIVISSELLTKYKDFKIVIFEGDADFICNVDGITEAVGRVRIGDAPEGLDKFDKYDWYIDEKKVGKYYKYENFEYYIIFGGSHMPAVESPIQLYDLFLRSTGVEGEGPKSSLVKLSRNGNVNAGEQSDPGKVGIIMITSLGASSLALTVVLSYVMIHKIRKEDNPSSTKETDSLITT